MQFTDWTGRSVEAAWAVFAVVWMVSALFAKRHAKRTGRRWVVLRIGLAIIFLVIIRWIGFDRTFLLWYIEDPALRLIGALIAVSGIALAIWARYHLGRNWGQPMTEKAGAELVMTGPYAYIRNPIYAGVFLMGAGASLVFGVLGGFLLVFSIATFVPSIFVEERIMGRLFPDAYPAYKARTRRIIPGVW